ncbi:MAG: MATE family efflux transporter [Geminicoccaceae bacterium]|nr:MAG: MATE family efflux transporter [Geminicoccaceae bacterium]
MAMPPASDPASRLLPVWTEWRALVALGFPLALTQLGQIAINTTDLVMMGWLGTEALAAGGLAVSIWILPGLAGIGLGIAVSPLVAQALAARQARQVRRSVRQGLWVVFAFMLPAALGLAHLGPLLELLGQAPSTVLGAEAYLRASAPGLPFAAGVVVLRAFVSGFGNTRAILVVMGCAVVGNAISNYLLMFGHFGLPRLELVGAGISSSLVNLLSFVALAVVVARRRPYRRYHVFGRFWRPDWATFGRIVKLGLPIALTLLFEVGMFSAAGILMGTVGTLPLAAHNVAMQLCSIVFMVPLGFSQAATIRVALAAGAGDRARVRLAGWLAVALVGGFMLLPAVVFWTLPHVLVRPFLDDPPAQAALVALVVRLMQVAAVFQLADGLQVVTGGVLRGLKDTAVPMVFAFVGYWLIGFGSAAMGLLVLGFGPLVVWLGLAVGLTLTAGLGLWRFHLLSRG